MSMRWGHLLDFRVLRPVRRVFRRVHLKYFGGIPEGTYERYGIQGTPAVYYTSDSAQWVIIGLAVFLGYTSLADMRTKEDLLANIEINRQKYYRQSFGVDYIDTTTKGLYDGPTGYLQVDPVTGIKKNLDGRSVAPPDDELRANLAKVHVTPEMVDRVKELRRQQLAHGTDQAHGKDEHRII